MANTQTSQRATKMANTQTTSQRATKMAITKTSQRATKMANIHPDKPESHEDGEHPDERAARSTLAAVHFDDSEAVSTTAARQPQTDAASRGVAT